MKELSKNESVNALANVLKSAEKEMEQTEYAEAFQPTHDKVQDVIFQLTHDLMKADLGIAKAMHDLYGGEPHPQSFRDDADILLEQSRGHIGIILRAIDDWMLDTMAAYIRANGGCDLMMVNWFVGEIGVYLDEKAALEIWNKHFKKMPNKARLTEDEVRKMTKDYKAEYYRSQKENK